MKQYFCYQNYNHIGSQYTVKQQLCGHCAQRYKSKDCFSKNRKYYAACKSKHNIWAEKCPLHKKETTRIAETKLLSPKYWRVTPNNARLIFNINNKALLLFPSQPEDKPKIAMEMDKLPSSFATALVGPPFSAGTAPIIGATTPMKNPKRTGAAKAAATAPFQFIYIAASIAPPAFNYTTAKKRKISYPLKTLFGEMDINFIAFRTKKLIVGKKSLTHIQQIAKKITNNKNNKKNRYILLGENYSINDNEAFITNNKGLFKDFKFLINVNGQFRETIKISDKIIATRTR